MITEKIFTNLLYQGFLEKKYLNSNNQKIKYGLDWVIINDKVKKIKLKKKIKRNTIF